MERLLGTLVRLALASLASAAGGGAATAIPILLLGKAWPPFTGVADLLMAMIVIPFIALIGSMFGAGLGMFVASPWTALAGTAMLALSGRLKLRSVIPWLGVGLLGGGLLVTLTPWNSIFFDRSGWALSFFAGAVGGMVAAWLFRGTWLALAGADKGDVPTF